MNACVSKTGLLRRLQYLLGALAFSFFALQQVAHTAPIVDSVDHRVTVTYSTAQFDVRKGVYSTQVRIKNHSAVALYSPLRLSFDQAALKNLRIKNAQGIGKDGQPYFEIKLPKGMLSAKASTEPIRIAVAVEKGRGAESGNVKAVFAALHNAQRVSSGVEVVLLNLSASPYALVANAGQQTVRFSVPVQVAAGAARSPVMVFLRRRGDKQVTAMNDLGKNGDFVAGDGIAGVNVQIDTRKIKPDSCLDYEALIRKGRAESTSRALRLCVTSFPVRAAAPNTAKPIVFPDGMKAVADEVLLFVAPSTSAAAIRQLARSINASVVGSIIPLNLYQLRLSAPASANQLSEIVSQLGARPGVTGASVNAVGEPAGHVTVATDPEFANQHGVKLVAKHPTIAGNYIWDAEAIGTGVTVVVADYGLDRAHPEFGAPGNCQLATDAVPGVPNTDCGGTNNDESTAGSVYQWHGTRVAGVIAAKALNGQGIAGVAHGSKIYSYKAASFALTDMDQIFIDVGNYVAMNSAASVINASFSGGPYTGALSAPGVSALCTAINTAVTSGFGAVVVNAVGNNNADNFYYPARCNEHANLLPANRNRLIAVGNSTSAVTRRCGNAGLEQRCLTDLDDGTKLGSNYGPWVEIVAPGSEIRTTVPLGSGSYTSATGTSFSAPIVSGAVAILKSCGVPLDQIESTLRSSANVSVPYPNAIAPTGSTPRLDIYRALQAHAPTAPALSTAESYTEGSPHNLTDIVIASNLSGCATFTATLTLSDSAAGSLTTGTSGAVTSTFAAGVWSASGPLADVNALLAGVTFNPASNYSSDFNIVTSVSDNISTINGTKAMHGIAVNSAPSFVAGADQTVPEDAGAQTAPGWATSISAGPADEAVQTLTFNITGNTNPALFSAAPAISPTGTLTYTAAANANGSATITVELMDNGGTANGGVDRSAPQTFVIAVTQVNDVPSFVAGADQTVPEDAGAKTVAGWATSISAGAADEAVQTLTFNITGNTNPALFTANPAVSPTGTLTYTPVANANGSAMITVELMDNGGTANGGVDTSAPQTFTIAVTPVNDAPSFIAGANQTAAEDAGPQTVPGWATSISAGPADEAAQTLTFNITGNTNPALFSAAPAISPAGTLTYAPAANANGSATITVELMDNGGTANGGADMSAPQTFVISVTPVNDPPTILGQPITFTHIEYNQVNMMSPPFVDDVGTVSANDLEGDALTFSITAGNELVVNGVLQPDAFRFDAANPGKLVVNNRLALNYEFLPPADPSFNLTVAVTDGVNPPVMAIVKITLTNDAFDTGDPHVTTVDGLHYDFQSAGEFVALRGANGMEIQVRQTAVSTATPLTDPNSGLTSGVSVNAALAARVGSHRVTYQPDVGGAAAGAPVLRVDGALTMLPPEGLDLGSGGRVSPVSGNGIQIDFPDQTTLIASSSLWSPYNVWWLNISVFHTPAHEGVMGARSKGSWLPKLSNGTALGPMPAALHDRYVDLYVKFADSWRVTKQTSLFDYAEGTSTATFTDKAWPKENGPYVAGPGPVAKPLGRKAALVACRDVAGKNEKADCVFDVMVMGHANVAKGHLLTQKLRLGATDVLVRGTDKVDARGQMVFTATVRRHAAIVPRERGVRIAPAGTVQFMLGGKPLGAPVKLDAQGQAKLKVSRLKIGKQVVTARYQPAKGGALLPSISKQAARALKPVGVRVPGNR